MKKMRTTASGEALLEAVPEIEAVIREHAPAAERELRLAPPVVGAMRRAGLFRMARPKSLGGLEVDPLTLFRVVEEVSRIDSAAGWNLQISLSSDPFGAWFPDETVREIFADPDTILGGGFNPPRRATPADGGYRVTGRTSFNSGAHQADWFLGLAHVFDGDRPRQGPDGELTVLLTACPASDVEIVDNWNTLGMCGTGSHDVSLTDVFVPERRAVPFLPLATPSRVYAGPLYRLTIWPGIAGMAVPALGIARASIDGLVELATKKTPAYTQKTLKDRAVVQTQLARAEAAVGAARAYLHAVFADAWADALAGRTITMDQKMKAQLAATNTVLAAAEAVDLVHAAVGATGIRREYDFQKYFRDVHVITQHAFLGESRLESVGRMMFGLDPEWGFFEF